MKIKQLTETSRGVKSRLGDGKCETNEDELAGIDRGLRAADAKRFASHQQIAAALIKLRNA
jgi:predicted transcriptional regulator